MSLNLGQYYSWVLEILAYNHDHPQKEVNKDINVVEKEVYLVKASANGSTGTIY